MYKKQKVMMIMNMGYVGDVLASSGLCQIIKENYPDCKLIMLTTPMCNQIAKNIPGVDEAFVFDKRGKDKGFLGQIKFALNFKYNMGKIDYCFLVNSYDRGAILSLLLGAKRKICHYDLNKATRWFLTDLIYPETINVVDEYTYYITPFKPFDPKYNIKIDCPQESFEKAQKTICEAGYDKFELIGLSTNSRDEKKDWNAQSVADYIKRINETGRRVILTGMQKAKKLAKEVRTFGVTEFLDLTCETSIEELMGVIKHCKVFVSVDTGSMHIAMALGKPTLCMFFDQKLTNHWGPKDVENNTLVVYPDKISGEECFIETEKLIKKAEELAAQTV